MGNRLAGEISPYLREHSEDPVAWWPWGPQAFAEAARLGKPVFISIGYSSSKWCRAMAQESFADPRVAALLNDRFVAIMVDRDELPEVDAIYMQAVVVMGEHGGWPVSAFCMPDGRPFYLGTYLGKQERDGRPSFSRAIQAMAEAYEHDHARLLENAEALTEGLAEAEVHMRAQATAQGDATPLSAATVTAACEQILRRIDREHGGLIGTPKFPSAPIHRLLARCGENNPAAREASARWTMAMVRGGLAEDGHGGGALDDAWQLAKGEMLLSDRSQLLEMLALARGWARDAERAQINAAAAGTIAWLVRELREPTGGLHAASGLGLAIRGLVAWHRASGDAAARALAVSTAETVWRNLWQGEGLARVYRDGAVKHDALLDDYAFVAAAFCDVSDASGEVVWWSRSAQLLACVVREFVGRVSDELIFYMTPPLPAGSPLIHRPESAQDGAAPSGAAIAIETMLRHGARGGDADAAALARQYLAQRLAGRPNPFAHATLLAVASSEF
ncbi:MAG: thioredoxin domain-containing protein [Myxococcales bacterium]|nr:thioredoxin domain-containing protein [Myxococcales bacterium]